MSQIETIMLVALGFAIAALIALFLSRFFWAVALRLGNKRLLRSTPTTIAELRADRDRLRAEYAMLSRKLQLKMDNIKTKLAEQMAEVTRNRNRIDHLIVEVRTRDAMLTDRDGELARLKAHVDPLEAELANRTQSFQSSRELLRGRDAEVARYRKMVEHLQFELADRDRRIEMLLTEAEGKDIDYALAAKNVLTAQDRLKRRISDLTSLSTQIESQRLELAQPGSEVDGQGPEALPPEPEPDTIVEREMPAESAFEPVTAQALEPVTAQAFEPVTAQAFEPVEDLVTASVPLEITSGAEVVSTEKPQAAEAAGAVAPLLIDEPTMPVESESKMEDAERSSLDTTFSARLAELKTGNEDQGAEPASPPGDSATESASGPPRGKPRAVTNVISLAARIRALQKTVGE
jgi:hypothetical protein